jgi:pimeloyl-ACP methyl ester carboxylesterase
VAADYNHVALSSHSFFAPERKAMTRIIRGYLDGPHGQLHYRRCGEGRPLLLLHQSPLSSAQFVAVMPGLAARGFAVCSLDMPGFGNSDPPLQPATLQQYVDAALAALDHFKWPRADLVGHHTGAVVGAMLAAATPQRVRRLVLNGFPLLTDAERAHYATFYLGPPQLAQDGSHLLQAWQNRLRSTPGWTDLALMNRYCIEALYSSQTNWMAFPLIMKTDLSALLRALRVPTLLLTNTGEDLYEATGRARALRPDFFRYVALQGGSHDIVDEQPQAWTEAVCEFLLAA